jgi:hypothetical protein
MNVGLIATCRNPTVTDHALNFTIRHCWQALQRPKSERSLADASSSKTWPSGSLVRQPARSTRVPAAGSGCRRSSIDLLPARRRRRRGLIARLSPDHCRFAGSRLLLRCRTGAPRPSDDHFIQRLLVSDALGSDNDSCKPAASAVSGMMGPTWTCCQHVRHVMDALLRGDLPCVSATVVARRSGPGRRRSSGTGRCGRPPQISIVECAILNRFGDFGRPSSRCSLG